MSSQYLTRIVVDVDVSGTPPLDLSKATKLKELSFRCGAVQCPADHDDAPNCSVETPSTDCYPHPYGTLVDPVEERILREWQDLDRLLVQFWTTHSIRPTVKCGRRKGGSNLSALVPSLFPELTRRGLIDVLVENY
jgi:hypothetical protein